jgi:hypothetical protein
LVAKTSPTFAEIKKNKSQQATIAVMVSMMDSCQQYFNLQQPMNAQQLALTAELILEDYYYLRVDELQVCFRMAMKGEFGPLYNRIDGQVFFEWIRKFMTKRQAVSERINTNQQSSNNIYEMFQHPQVVDAIHQAADKLKIEQAPAQEAKDRKPSEFEQKLIDEYDALPFWEENNRFRLYKKTPFQFTEYRMWRYRELIEQQNEY